MAQERARQIAEHLLSHFGTISHLADAPSASLVMQLPEDPAVAKALIAGRELTKVGMQEKLVGAPIDPEDPSLLRYLSRAMAGSQERLHAIFLTADNLYIADERLAVGCSARVRLRQRDILGRAIQLNAAKVIIAHNHPSGSCHPSENDIIATRQILATAQALDVEIVDHLIISGTGAYSMRKGGQL